MPECRAVTMLAVLLCLAAGCGPTAAQPEQEAPDRTEQRHLLIVLDGLRPDYRHAGGDAEPARVG